MQFGLILMADYYWLVTMRLDFKLFSVLHSISGIKSKMFKQQ